MVTAQGHDGHGSGGAAKITKARSKVVKPILKKLSYSEKGSLDLDRSWDEQQLEGMWEPITTGKSAKDVSFIFGAAGARGSSGGRSALSGKEGVVVTGASSSGNVARKPFHQHGRSHSGASVATNGSGGGMRAGSFVHPFQQMPRTSTPPLSYANSLASFDTGSGNVPRDYSPTITENEDDDGGISASMSASTSAHPPLTNLNHMHSHSHSHHASFSSSVHHQPTVSTHSSTFSHTALRRPLLASQRTSSLTDITSALTSAPQLRVSTNGRSTPSTSRLAPSKSDLHLNLTATPSDLESPVGSLGGYPTLISASTAPPGTIASPTSTSIASPLSPLRTSLEAMGIPTPRLRSRSEVDSAARQEHIRQARRKFEERQRVKEEKYEREEVEKRNRQATKEATRIEKQTKEWYKATGVSIGSVVVGVAGHSSGGSHNGSSADVNASMHGDSILQPPPACAQMPGRPSASRRTTPTSVATTSASAPAHLLGRSVGAGVFGGKSRKGSFGMAGTAGTATTAGSRPDLFTATGTGGYPSNGSSSRKNSGGFWREKNQANDGDAEKGLPYDSLPQHQDMPRFGRSIGDAEAGRDSRKDRHRRSSDAKQKTQKGWQGFVMWLRTKIFRIRKR